MTNSAPYSYGLQYAVDIVLCIDATSSMTPLLEMVKTVALSFHRRLEEVMADKAKSISQLRLKIIAFRDFGDNPNDAIVQTDFLLYPQDARTLQRFIRELSAHGGGDVPESGLEALASAMNSTWETGLDRRRHVIVLFTDAPAHPLGSVKGLAASTYPQDIPQSLDELGKRWGHKGSNDSVMENSAKRLLLFAPDTGPWNAIAEDWNNTIFFPSRAGDGLQEWEMEEIIQTISNSL